jgi:lipid-binding SYLF domain-containing protein
MIALKGGRKMIRKLGVLLTTVAVFWMLSPLATATTAPVASDERERAVDAGQVLTQILKAPDNTIPEDLLKNAHAIAVIPHVVKGAFMFGGEYGKGLVSQRRSDGTWTAPAYVDLTGGSFGLQIGAAATDIVLVFTNPDGIKPLLKGKVKLGADATVAAGPVGRSASAGTDITMKAAVYSYSRSKGAFAGIALDGAVLSIDNHADRRAYGAQVTGQDILLMGKVKPNDNVEPFLEALRKDIPA